MLNNESLISIIMPAYNADKYIHTAIESILNQTYQNWELLIINDGSTDNTEAIIKNYTDIRIITIKHKNLGVSAARNVGLSEMKGTYFCFLDADDFFPANSLQSRLNVFKKNPIINFVDGSVNFYDKNLTILLKNWKPDYRGNPKQELITLSGKVFFGNTWMIKREKGKKYLFKQGMTHSEDLLFYISIINQNSYYDYTEDAVLHYRTGHQSTMKNIKGLEKGYTEVYYEIRNSNKITDDLLNTYKAKARSIILNSYLGNNNFIDALLFITKSWK